MDLDELKQHKKALMLGGGAGLLALLWLSRKGVNPTAPAGPSGDTTGTVATGTDAAPAGLPYMGPGSQGSDSWPDWTQPPDGAAGPPQPTPDQQTGPSELGVDAPAPGASPSDLYSYLIQQPTAAAVIPGYNSVADVPQLPNIKSTSDTQLGFNQVTGQVEAGSWQGATWVPATSTTTTEAGTAAGVATKVSMTAR